MGNREWDKLGFFMTECTRQMTQAFLEKIGAVKGYNQDLQSFKTLI